MLFELVSVEMLVSSEGEILNFLSLSFHHAVDDRYAVAPDFSIHVHLNIKEAFATEIPYEVLPAFLNHFGSEAVLFVNRQQLVLGPRPKMRAFDLGVDNRARVDLKMNVGPVGRRIVIGPDQLYLSGEV